MNYAKSAKPLETGGETDFFTSYINTKKAKGQIRLVFEMFCIDKPKILYKI